MHSKAFSNKNSNAFSLISIHKLLIFSKRVHETQKWMRLAACHLCLPSKMRHNADGCKINASSCVQNAFIGYMGYRKKICYSLRTAF